jgi:hypothetical protein
MVVLGAIAAAACDCGRAKPVVIVDAVVDRDELQDIRLRRPSPSA